MDDDNDDILIKLNAFTEYGDEADLTQWERSFMEDQIKRYEQYAERTRFSEKQIAVIDRVYDKLPI